MLYWFVTRVICPTMSQHRAAALPSTRTAGLLRGAVPGREKGIWKEPMDQVWEHQEDSWEGKWTVEICNTNFCRTLSFINS